MIKNRLRDKKRADHGVLIYSPDCVCGAWKDRSILGHIKQDGPWWVGWIEEIPGVNCQESNYEELIESLKDATSEALEFKERGCTS